MKTKDFPALSKQSVSEKTAASDKADEIVAPLADFEHVMKRLWDAENSEAVRHTDGRLAGLR